MLYCLFTEKLLIYFYSHFWKKLILPVEKFSLKGKIMRNLQAIGKKLLECKWLVQFYRSIPVHPAFSSGTHVARLTSGAKLCFRKSESFMFFGRLQMRSWRLLPSLMWITDICRIATAVTNTSQAPERKMPKDEQHTKGSCAGCCEWWVPRWKVLLFGAEPPKQACCYLASCRPMNNSTD